MNNDNNTEPVLYAVGARGYSAYEVAVQNGFVGTEQEWLDSLVGPEGQLGPEGKSAYQIAVDNGFIGTEEEWVHDFLTPDGYYTMEEINSIVSGQLKTSDVINNLDSNDTDKPLSAKQGKTLNDRINTVDSKASANTLNLNSEIAARIAADDNLIQQITGLGSGAPIPVASTSAMSDTTKLYVLTTDGYVYYYDGNDWTQGWEYQAAEDSETVDKLEQNVNDGYLSKFNLWNYQIKTNGTFEANANRVSFANHHIPVKKGAVVSIKGYEGLEYARAQLSGDGSSACTVYLFDTPWKTADMEWIIDRDCYINIVVRKTGGDTAIDPAEDLIEVKIYDSIPSRLTIPSYINSVVYDTRTKVDLWFQGFYSASMAWINSTYSTRIGTGLIYVKKGTQIDIVNPVGFKHEYLRMTKDSATKLFSKKYADSSWRSTDLSITIPEDCYFGAIVARDDDSLLKPEDNEVEIYIHDTAYKDEMNKETYNIFIPHHLGNNENVYTVKDWMPGNYQYRPADNYDVRRVQYWVPDDKTVTMQHIIYVPKGTVIEVKGTANPDAADAIGFQMFGCSGPDYLSYGYEGYSLITDYRYNGNTYKLISDSYIFINLKRKDSSTISYTDVDVEVTFDFTHCYHEKRIKDYFVNEMTTTIDTIKSKMDEPCIVFGLTTDIHYKSGKLPGNFNNMIQNVDYLKDYVPLDFFVNLGDNTDGEGDKQVTKNRAHYLWDEMTRWGLPVYNVYGNHDDGRYSYHFSWKEMFQTYMRLTKKAHFDTTSDGRNYYFDMDEFNFRFIFAAAINNYQYAFSDSTANWIINTALDTDKDVVFFSHLSPIYNQNYANTNPANGSRIAAALETHHNNGHAVLQFCGHSHTDYEYSSPYPCFFSCCQKFEAFVGDEPGLAYQQPEAIINTVDMRHIGDYTEDCWTVVIIRPTSRKVSLVRFGVGDDREMTY